MKEKNLIELRLSTIILIFTIIIIAIMTYFIFRLSNEKKSVEEKVNKLNDEIYNLENKSSNLQEKIDIISNTINNNIDANNEIDLDSQYNNNDYGISFSYPSNFSKLEDTSLIEHSVETLQDNNGNSITITKDNNTIDEVINNVKTLTTSDGTLFNTNIKEDGYITSGSGVTGYKMQMLSNESNTIKFITQKDNTVFIFSFIINENLEQYLNIFNNIIDTISIN